MFYTYMFIYRSNNLKAPDGSKFDELTEQLLYWNICLAHQAYTYFL